MLNIINTQYIYINSVNRGPTDDIFDLEIDLPDGMVKCNPDTESLGISATSFNITKNWYYVNETNDYIKILGPDGNTVFEHHVTPSNYTFKKLSTYITESVPFPITMSYDSNRNKYLIYMPTGYSLDFRPENSMWYILGFEEGDIITQSSQQIISKNVLNVNLSRNISIYIDNITPDKNVSAIENSSNNSAVPSTCLLSVANDFAPYTVKTFENTDNLFRINIKEKVLTKLRISVRDEYKELMRFITDYHLVLKIDTYSNDNSLQTKQLSTLQSIEEYMRLNFVSSNINKV